MTIVPKQDGESKAATDKKQQLIKLQVTQTGKIKQEINTWSDGQTIETWTINGEKLVENPGSHGVLLVDPAHDRLASYYMRYDLSLLSWVSLNTYVSVETHEGHHCYMYKNGPLKSVPNGAINASLPNPSATLAEGFTGPGTQVWVDAETHQLVSVDDGRATYDFTFGPPPTTELILPPKFASLWQGYQDAMNPLKNLLPPSH